MKPKVFIGSSSEKLPVLDYVKKQLADTCDVSPWTDQNVFIVNQSALDSLVRQAKLSDFAILIATKDDHVSSPSRDQTRETPRDNIIFEFGLFLGALSLKRVFLLAEEGTGLPSDLNGITVLTYSTDALKHNALENRCVEISRTIQAQASQGDLAFVPSTALAFGYYNSYVKRLCKTLDQTRAIILEDKQLPIKQFKLRIVLPKDIDDDGVGDFADRYKASRKLVSAFTTESNTGNNYSAFRLSVNLSSAGPTDQHEIIIYDIPTTLNTIKEILKAYYPSAVVGRDSDRDHLEKRELTNFANVLRRLLDTNSLTKDQVTLEEQVSI